MLLNKNRPDATNARATASTPKSIRTNHVYYTFRGTICQRIGVIFVPIFRKE
nr:MAG TPA: hypothetical protein [Caudoviricetes sp.]